MIVTYTDFGIEGPYLGQMRGVLQYDAPDVPVIDLMVDAPVFDIRASAYLLAASIRPFEKGTVCLAVVDPGVGSNRRAIVLYANEQWFVGPDNGLFELLARRSAHTPEWWEITFSPTALSASFHGRDLFAPVAARIANGDIGVIPSWGRSVTYDQRVGADWPDDWDCIVYIDRYGNCMTGRRWSELQESSCVMIGDLVLPVSRTFSDRKVGEAFCYQNALGLLEIAVNQGNAANQLGILQGSQVSVRNLSGK